MWGGGGGGANEVKVDQTTAMYFLFYSSKLETSEFVILFLKFFLNFSLIFKVFFFNVFFSNGDCTQELILLTLYIIRPVSSDQRDFIRDSNKMSEGN